MTHYSDNRRWSPLHNAWVFKEDWTQSDEIAALDAQLVETRAENERLKEKEAHRIKVIRENENLLHSNIELRRKIEALSSTGAVKVKALEWAQARISDKWQRYTAQSPFGLYEVLEWSDGTFGGSIPSVDGEGPDIEFSSDTLEIAKSVAQADYERRILSALAPHPRDTNTVVSHETGNVRDKPTAPEGEQEAAVTREMVNAAYNTGKDRCMTGAPNDFRAVLKAALKAAMEAGLVSDPNRYHNP